MAYRVDAPTSAALLRAAQAVHDRDLAAMQLNLRRHGRQIIPAALARPEIPPAAPVVPAELYPVTIDDYASPRKWTAGMRSAARGDMPAEALPTVERHAVIKALHRDGWTDEEMSVRLRMTLYTTARIRGDILGLRANHGIETAAA